MATFTEDFEGSDGEWYTYTSGNSATMTTDHTGKSRSGSNSAYVSNNVGLCGYGGVARDFVGTPQQVEFYVQWRLDNWASIDVIIDDGNVIESVWTKGAGGSSESTSSWQYVSIDISSYNDDFTLYFGNYDNSDYCSISDHGFDVWFDDITVTYIKPVTSPSNPQNPNAIYIDDDQVDFSFDAPSDWGGEEGSYEVQMERGGGGYSDPAGGPSAPSSAGTYSYGPNSDTAYGRQVGIDSSFRFRVQAENSAGTSGWVVSNTVYTTPVSPHNPSVSRPDGDSITIQWTDNSDIADKTALFYRKDTGGGYGSWNYVDSISVLSVSKGTSRSVTATVNNDSWMENNARYQFRLRHEHINSERDSEYVYADYGNNGNVFFKDDFESGDLSAWDTTDMNASSGVKTSSWNEGLNELGINGPDSGSNYLWLESGGDVRVNLGDLSDETDVLIKAVVASGSLDTSGEDNTIEFYDGSGWQTLKTYTHEYNRQGWVEMCALVSSSMLSTDNRLRLQAYDAGGSVDYFAIDRVVVSDILHIHTTLNVVRSISSYASPIGGGSTGLIDLKSSISSYSTPTSSTSIRVIDLLEAVESHSGAIDSSVSRRLDVIGSAISHMDTSSSSSELLIDISSNVGSHSDNSKSSALRILDVIEDVSSHSESITANGSRSGITFVRIPKSHTDKVSSFTYNERTSLEVIDHTVDWDDDEAVWYTNWFQETRILGNEDTLAIRSLVVKDAKDPAATVVVQYDSDGNGEVDMESEPVRIGQDESVEEIRGIPVDEDANYRLKIMEYSGYNSLYAIDTAIVH